LRWSSWWPWRRSFIRALSIDFAGHVALEKRKPTKISTQRAQSTQRRYKGSENSVRPLAQSRMFVSLHCARCVLRGEMPF
jgi:hypothetical protein